MKAIKLFLGSLLWVFPAVAAPSPKEILEQVDQNLVVSQMVSLTKMTIHGNRGSRNMTAKTWTLGEEKSFSEYLAPPREAGTKMLKLKDRLWIYYPSADRTVAIAGHMLRNSMMGSDLSYEDMMENVSLTEDYQAQLVEPTEQSGRAVWVLELTAKRPDISYQKRKLWIDQERYLPLRQELYAQSGKLLKVIEVLEVMRTAKGWYPKKMRFKDQLKEGEGTLFEVLELDLKAKIPASKFNKAALRR